MLDQGLVDAACGTSNHVSDLEKRIRQLEDAITDLILRIVELEEELDVKL